MGWIAYHRCDTLLVVQFRNCGGIYREQKYRQLIEKNCDKLKSMSDRIESGICDETGELRRKYIDLELTKISMCNTKGYVILG